MIWRYGKHGFRLLALLLFLLLILAPEWPAFVDEAHQLNRLVGLRQFDFLIWETNAILAKAEAILADGHSYLDEETQQMFVLDYLTLIGEIKEIEGEMNAIYIDPTVLNPEEVTQDLQVELARKRAVLEEVQPLAEAIIQDQVAAVLVDEGFAITRQAWPPVLMHMTPLPSILIVSPRHQIERVYQIPLIHGLSTPDKDALETAVFEQLDLSAIVEPIGGLGTYPSMITESSNINWVIEVTAHEWTHIWLGYRPLGLNYSLDAQVRIINETAVSLIDQEIAALVIARYYPQFIPPPPPPPSPDDPPVAPDAETPPPFDFRAEMAETRNTVDDLLAKGEIAAAEAYMEARRRVFVNNGYGIRKLNQAYFAFHGAYAEREGAAGRDPIGPLLRDIRDHSTSIHDFLQRVAPIASFADLEAVHRQAVGGD